MNADLASVSAAGLAAIVLEMVADVFARLFVTNISTPPSDRDFGDDAQWRRFAHEILTPIVERVV